MQVTYVGVSQVYKDDKFAHCRHQPDGRKQYPVWINLLCRKALHKCAHHLLFDDHLVEALCAYLCPVSVVDAPWRNTCWTRETRQFSSVLHVYDDTLLVASRARWDVKRRDDKYATSRHIHLTSSPWDIQCLAMMSPDCTWVGLTLGLYLVQSNVCKQLLSHGTVVKVNGLLGGQGVMVTHSTYALSCLSLFSGTSTPQIVRRIYSPQIIHMETDCYGRIVYNTIKHDLQYIDPRSSHEPPSTLLTMDSANYFTLDGRGNYVLYNQVDARNQNATYIAVYDARKPNQIAQQWSQQCPFYNSLAVTDWGDLIGLSVDTLHVTKLSQH